MIAADFMGETGLAPLIYNTMQYDIIRMLLLGFCAQKQTIELVVNSFSATAHLTDWCGETHDHSG